MIPDLQTRLHYDLAPGPDESIAEWAEREIDFSRAPNYDCADIVGPYRVAVAPYTRRILEAIQDPAVRKIIVKKCSRSGVTEAVSVAIRWHVACRPLPTYYMTANQDLSEGYMERRFKRGMALSRETERQYARARRTEHEINFPGMDFRVSWPRAKGAFKQDGWALIVADEASTWEQSALDQLDKRAGTYRFHTIIVLSSPDPTRKSGKAAAKSVRGDADPVIAMYDATNQERWAMPDPVTGNLFQWELGGADTPHGIKWPSDCRDPETGKWDLARVAREAYYVTPDGTRIDNADRLAVSRTGDYTETATGGRPEVVGIEIVAPMVPFSDGDFGTLATRFLQAKRAGYQELRTYFMENWSRDYAGEVDRFDDASLAIAAADYTLGQIASTLEHLKQAGRRVVIMTVDVQNDHFWYVVREWFDPGHSYLIDYSRGAAVKGIGSVCRTWQQLRDARNRNKAQFVFIDNRYHLRQDEVIAQCAGGIMAGAVPVYGHDRLSDRYGRPTHSVTHQNKDPYEGTAQQGACRLTWVTTVPSHWKTVLYQLINGKAPQAWKVPTDIGSDYTEQITCWENVNGEWISTSRNDHLGDCETMQTLAAHLLRVLTELDTLDDIGGGDDATQPGASNANADNEEGAVSYGDNRKAARAHERAIATGGRHDDEDEDRW